MVILGIDPGIATVGFGVIRAEGSAQQVVRYGAVTTPAGIRLSARLRQIYGDVCELIDTFRPDAIAIEQLFFNTNITTGISVAHGRGVIILAGEEKRIEIDFRTAKVRMDLPDYVEFELVKPCSLAAEYLVNNCPGRPQMQAWVNASVRQIFREYPAFAYIKKKA